MSHRMVIEEISVLLQDTIGTKVLIPFPGGLIELFVTKQVCDLNATAVLVSLRLVERSIDFWLDQLVRVSPLPEMSPRVFLSL